MNPEEIVKKVFNACNPNSPAEDFYIDCRKARGGDLLASKVIDRLKNLETNYLRFLFTGHKGSGKTSELLYLVDLLKDKHKEQKLYPIYVDVNDYINFESATFDEILLAIAVEISDQFLTGLNIKLENTYFKDKFGKIKDFFVTERKFSDVEINLFGLAKTNIQKIKENDKAKQQLFESINQDNKSLLDELNLFIYKANLELTKKTGYSKILLIVDSLEKIKKFENQDDELVSQKNLFVGNQEKLTNIDAHVIYTIPLNLYYSDSGPTLKDYYGYEPLDLPMVKVFQRDNFEREFPLGCEAFRQILTKRFGKISLEQVFDKDSLAFLIKYSGGNIRNFMLFVQESVLNADSLPVTFQVARKSVQPTVRNFARSIRQERFNVLADLNTSEDQQIDIGNPEVWAMLENLTIMEYVNGDGSTNLDDVWYAVNPCAKETLGFKSAVEQKSQLK
jgi:hypothetical protein